MGTEILLGSWLWPSSPWLKSAYRVLFYGGIVKVLALSVTLPRWEIID